MGCDFVCLDQVDVCRHIVASIGAGHGGWVLTANLDILRRWVIDDDFRALTREVSLCVADGAPVVWASRLQGTPVPERVSGADLFISLSGAAADHGHSIFLIGGNPGTAQASSRELQRRYPGLEVVGTDCPALGFERDPQQMREIQERLAASGADIVYVALGSPKQEIVIKALRESLPRSWWLGVGASFSFLAGDLARAPVWIQRLGLEWFYRLCQEPRRLAGRYLRDDLPFLFRLLFNVVCRRFR